VPGQTALNCCCENLTNYNAVASRYARSRASCCADAETLRVAAREVFQTGSADTGGQLARFLLEVSMKRIDLSFSQLLFIIGTRVALAAGVGLLLSEKLPSRRRRPVGLTLVALGALTTLPSVLFVRHGLQEQRERLIA
jgi:hypothetical protein